MSCPFLHLPAPAVWPLLASHPASTPSPSPLESQVPPEKEMSLTHSHQLNTGLVSRHSLKANNERGLAVSLQPGPNAAFIINHRSNLFSLQNEQYMSSKTTDLLKHLYKHQTLNSLFKKAEINPIRHDIRKVKICNATVKLV